MKSCVEAKSSNSDDNNYGDSLLKDMCLGKIKTTSWLLLLYSENIEITEALCWYDAKSSNSDDNGRDDNGHDDN